MSASFKVKVQTHFSAARQIKGYEGPCANIHGNTFVVKATIKTSELDDLGLSIDYKVLSDNLETVITPLKHQNLNNLKEFESINPSSENIAKYIYTQLKILVNNEGFKLKKISIQEAPNVTISYSE